MNDAMVRELVRAIVETCAVLCDESPSNGGDILAMQIRTLAPAFIETLQNDGHIS